jgi:hypothetical protein
MIRVHDVADYYILEDTRVIRAGAGLKQATVLWEQIAGTSALWYLRPMRGVAQPG